MKSKNLSDHSTAAAGLLSAMANPKRLMILCSLVKGEVPVGVLATQVGLSQSALSQHLSKLRIPAGFDQLLGAQFRKVL